MSGPAAPGSRLPAAFPEAAPIYLRPIGLTCGKAAEKLAAAGRARRLAGGPWFFAACEVVLRGSDQVRRASAPLQDIEAWAGSLQAAARKRVETRLARLVAPRFAPGGTPLVRPLVMGVVDVASDRFAGRGRFDPEAAAAHGRGLAAAGADLLEVVGQSARQGAGSVAPEAEAARILPVLRGLADLAGTVLSIATRHAEVAARALEAGVTMIGDGLLPAGDPRRLPAITVVGAQSREGGDSVFEIFDDLEARIEASLAAGLAHARLIAAPGLAPGHDRQDDTAILNDLALFHGLGCPLLLDLPFDAAGDGPGRAFTLRALDQGAQILRTREVAEIRQVLDLWERLIASRG